MKRTTSNPGFLFWTFAVLLVAPTVSAALSWSDPAGDHEKGLAKGMSEYFAHSDPYELSWNPNWTWEAAGEAYRFADLRRVAFVNETPDHLVFEVEVASTDSSTQDPYLFDRVNYNIHIDFRGRSHLLWLARPLWGTPMEAGLAVRETSTTQSFYRPSFGMVGVTDLESGRGWRLTVPKAGFTDPAGFQLWEGDMINVVSIVSLDTMHNPNRADFDDTHTCDDGTGNLTWCFPKVRDIVSVGGEHSISITKKPQDYGPLIVPQSTFGRDYVYDRGYNATYLLAFPFFNLGHGPESFTVTVDAPEGWRVVHPLGLEAPPRASGTVPVLVMASQLAQSYGRYVQVSLTSRHDPDATFSHAFEFQSPSFIQPPIPTPARNTVYVHANHATSLGMNGVWFGVDPQDAQADPQHAVPVWYAVQQPPSTVQAMQDFEARGVGYRLGQGTVDVSWNVTFPAAFEGSVQAILQTVGNQTVTLGTVNLGTVAVSAGQTHRFQGGIPILEQTLVPTGQALRVRLQADGELQPPPEGTRPIDYGMPPSAMGTGRIAFAMQQAGTWVRFPLLPLNDTYDASLFPDPLLSFERPPGYGWGYGGTEHHNVEINVANTFGFNVTNAGLVAATVTWRVEGNLSAWMQPIQTQSIVPAGGRSAVTLGYIGTPCEQVGTTTDGRLVGQVQGHGNLTKDLRVDIRPSYPQPPECNTYDDESLPGPGLLASVLALGLVLRMARRRRSA